MSKFKKTVITIFVVALCIGGVIFYKQTMKTKYNDSTVIGNTAGNLYNGGIFCKQGDTIYFSNSEDDGSLYSMDMSFGTVKKIHSDKPAYLNGDDHYLYYSRQNWTKENPVKTVFIFTTSGLYRINKNGKSIVPLYNKPAGVSLLAGNYIYYQHYDGDEGLFLYKVKIDGKNQKLLLEESAMPASVVDGNLYFSKGSTSSDHDIYTMDLATDTISTLYPVNSYMPIVINSTLYYISLSDNYAICKLDLNTMESTILVNEFCSTYNISDDGNTLYYQIDGGDNNRIAAMDLTTGTQTTLMDGNYKNIHVIDRYVFFRDFDETNTYLLDSKTGSLNLFTAPVDKD